MSHRSRFCARSLTGSTTLGRSCLSTRWAFMRFFLNKLETFNFSCVFAQVEPVLNWLTLDWGPQTCAERGSLPGGGSLRQGELRRRRCVCIQGPNCHSRPPTGTRACGTVETASSSISTSFPCLERSQMRSRQPGGETGRPVSIRGCLGGLRAGRVWIRNVNSVALAGLRACVETGRRLFITSVGWSASRRRAFLAAFSPRARWILFPAGTNNYALDEIVGA